MFPIRTHLTGVETLPAEALPEGKKQGYVLLKDVLFLVSGCSVTQHLRAATVISQMSVGTQKLQLMQITPLCHPKLTQN